MKRRTFLRALTAFAAAPLAFLGAKKVATDPIIGTGLWHDEPHLIDNDKWFLKDTDQDFLYFSSKEPLQSIYMDGDGNITEASWWNGKEWIPIK